MKEAAEKNTMIGNADYHLSINGNAQNPIGWSGSQIKQATLASWSTLGINTACVGGVMSATLAPGYYFMHLNLNWTATGAADYYWATNASQTDYTILASSNPTGATKLSQSGVNLNIGTWVHVKVTGPGTNSGVFNIFNATGASTGWVSALTLSSLHIFAMPTTETTFLMHPDPKIRSLAWSRFRDGSDEKLLIKKEIADALREAGVEKKEKKLDCKYTIAIEQRHCELLDLAARAVCICGRNGCTLCAPSSSDQTPSTCPLCIERYGQSKFKKRSESKRPITPEDDCDDYEDFEAFRFQMKRDPVLRVREEDEKSDRSKPAQKRASSLKS
jgi:hypothetical protein